MSEIAKEDPALWFRTIVPRLGNIARMDEALARYIAIQGVEQGFLSRRLAAEMLGVHQATIARWLKDEAWSDDLREAMPTIDQREKWVADERLDSHTDD